MISEVLVSFSIYFSHSMLKILELAETASSFFLVDALEADVFNVDRYNNQGWSFVADGSEKISLRHDQDNRIVINLF